MERYRIIEKLNSGQSGAVFRIMRMEDGANLVLKRIPLMDLDASQRDQAKMEVELMKQLHHPHVVPYRDAFLFNGEDLCIIMEYYTGGDLSSVIADAASSGQHFSETQVLRWFVEMLLAMHYLHSHRILHRDLKAQNVFLDGNRQVTIGDFGVAKILETTHSVTSTTSGTPLYMAPEVLQGNICTFKSDVWSLGCILYEMLCFTHPFEARDISGLVIKVIRGGYEAVPGKYSPAMAKLVDSMLERDPTKRPNVDDLLMTPIVKSALNEFCRQRVERHLTDPDEAAEGMLRGQLELLGVSAQSCVRTAHQVPSNGVPMSKVAAAHQRQQNQQQSQFQPQASLGLGRVQEGKRRDAQRDHRSQQYESSGSTPDEVAIGGGGANPAWLDVSPLRPANPRDAFDDGEGENRYIPALSPDAADAPMWSEASPPPPRQSSQQPWQRQQQQQPSSQASGTGLPRALPQRSSDGALPLPKKKGRRASRSSVGGSEQELDKGTRTALLYEKARERDDTYLQVKRAKQEGVFGTPKRPLQDIVASLSNSPVRSESGRSSGVAAHPGYNYPKSMAQPSPSRVYQQHKEIQQQYPSRTSPIPTRYSAAPDMQHQHSHTAQPQPHQQYMQGSMSSSLVVEEEMQRAKQRRKHIEQYSVHMIGLQPFRLLCDYCRLRPDFSTRNTEELRRLCQNDAAAPHVVGMVDEYLNLESLLS